MKMNLNDLIYNNIPRLVIALIVALVYYTRGQMGAVAVLSLSVIFVLAHRLGRFIFNRWNKKEIERINELCEVE